jgi:GxxExxY protein
MKTNDTNKIIYKELSYTINGLLFKVHNELGRFCREKQYCDLLENKLVKSGLSFKREKNVAVDGIENNFTNILDFIINDQVVVEIKAKPIITKDDYYQLNRYLEASKLKLGMIVNFRNKYLKPIRVIRANS